MGRTMVGAGALAVVAALLAPVSCAADKVDVERAIARGVKFLKSRQAADGHFSESNTPALTALPLWAFVAAGEGGGAAAKKAAAWVLAQQKEDGGFYTIRPPRKPRPRRDARPAPGVLAPADSKLSGGSAGVSSLGTYNTAVCLSALYESGLAPVESVLKARTFLADSQLSDGPMAGGFGYGRGTDPRARADLSNTAYAMGAMKRTEAAEEFRAAGGRRADLDWDRALAYVESLQQKDGEGKGGFAYNAQFPRAGTATNAVGRVTMMSYGAMTYDGLLSMCYANLTRGDPRVKSALEYCSKFWSVDENPGRGLAGLYYYYDVLSRALATAKVDELAGLDGRKIAWKRELAAKVLSLQAADGSWSNSDNSHWENNPVLVTSFAVLALSLCR